MKKSKFIFLSICLSAVLLACAQPAGSNTSSNQTDQSKKNDQGDQPVESTITDNDGQKCIEVVPLSFSNEVYWVDNKTNDIFVEFTSSSGGNLYTYINGKEEGKTTFSYSNGVITTYFGGNTGKGFLFKTKEGELYEAYYHAWRVNSNATGLFCEWENDIHNKMTFYSDGSLKAVYSNGSTKNGRWNNSNGIITCIGSDEATFDVYYTSDGYLYNEVCHCIRVNKVGDKTKYIDNQKEEENDNQEPDNKEVEEPLDKSVAVAAVKKLIDIPKVAVTNGSDFTYCDLPISIQGYKDVSISWKTEAEDVEIDGSLLTLKKAKSEHYIYLIATITCQEYSETEEYKVKVYPANETSLFDSEWLEAARFSLCFEKDIRENSYAKVYKKIENLGSKAITIESVTSDGNAADIYGYSSYWSVRIYNSVAKRTVKVTVKFKLGSTSVTRDYYIQSNFDKRDYKATSENTANLDSGKYIFDDDYLTCIPSSSNYGETIYKYDVSETDQTMKLSVYKKEINGKLYTKQEWLNQYGLTESESRRVQAQFFENRVFDYNIYGDYLSIKGRWETDLHWTLQAGKLVESTTDAAFGLPVKEDCFTHFHNSSRADFPSLKNRTGTFNSDYTIFTDSGKRYNVSCYEKDKKHYVSFTSGSESWEFLFTPYDLVKIHW